MTDKDFMARAIQLAEYGMENGSGGPFGAVVVKDGKIIGEGCNNVISKNDPTAHAEILAIREACKNLGSFQLDDCTIYTSCEPCPMCLGAIYWARLKKVFFACTQEDAADIAFDDQHIYEELEKQPDDRQIKFENLMRSEALPLFKKWKYKSDKTSY
ncbi:MAG: nucleoside deaminase [Mariniphaga sp.]